MQVNGRNPLLGIVVEIEECYIHCAKAFIRSKMWDPESWLHKKSYLQQQKCCWSMRK